MRAETIQSRSYSQPFNPITGVPVQPVSVMLTRGPASAGAGPASQYSVGSQSSMQSGSKMNSAMY